MFGLSVVLELKVENSTILTEEQRLLLSYFDNFDFQCSLLLKEAQFSTFNSKTTEWPKIFLWPFSYFFGLTY